MVHLSGNVMSIRRSWYHWGVFQHENVKMQRKCRPWSAHSMSTLLLISLGPCIWFWNVQFSVHMQLAIVSLKCINSKFKGIIEFRIDRFVAPWGHIIEIIDIECVLGHESCLHFFRKCPFKTAMLNLTRSRTAELYYRKFIINRSLNITFTV